MVDRPRDKPQVERDAAALAPVAPAQEIGGRDVIAYLKQHPDFLDRHPEALRLLRAPSREVGEEGVDFQHFMIERLRGELARVNLEHRTLIAASRGNLSSQGRVHKAALAILAAPSFEQLWQIVTTDLLASSSLVLGITISRWLRPVRCAADKRLSDAPGVLLNSTSPRRDGRAWRSHPRMFRRARRQTSWGPS